MARHDAPRTDSIGAPTRQGGIRLSVSPPSLMRLILLTLTFAAVPAFVVSQTPQDVPKDHWAYDAVNDLAGKGLIKGYPPDGNFFGKRTATRYEMATIVQRVLMRIDELLAKKAEKSDIKPAPVG